MPPAERGMLPAVALLSAAALGYELLLLRFFSLMYWHHFAHLIISMALLGIGASGSYLALAQGRILPYARRAFTAAALLFALTLPSAISLAGRIGFNPPEVLWDSGQLARLAAVFLLATLPFGCAGLGIGLCLRWRSDLAARIYRADLVGAAAGSLLVMLLLSVLAPEDSVRMLALAGLASAAIVSSHDPERRMRHPVVTVAVLLVLPLLVLCWPGQWLAPIMSPYKGLSQALRLPGVRIASETLAPSGSFTALVAERIPFRQAPGLSMLAPATPPEQVALFHDGHGAGVILRGEDGAAAMEFLRWTPMALPYALLHRPRVLVCGAGGGGDVRHALLEQAAHVDAAEAHRELTDLARDQFRTFAGDLYRDGRVRLHHTDPRGVLAAATRPWDLIQISPLGTAAPLVGGGHALAAQYLYTVDGLRLALARLSAHGILCITMPLDLPPRLAVKLLATVAEALRQNGAADPALQLMVLRTWNTVTIAASPSPYSPRQIGQARDFARSRAFDLDWLPGIGEAEVNRINVLERPFLHEAAKEIWTSGRHGGWDLFRLEPATDDRPWFSHVFRWSAFNRLWAERGSGTASMLEWEYLLLWMSLAVAFTVSLLLIAWPLRLLRSGQASRSETPGDAVVTSLYFAALGLAFLFLEIALLHQFLLFLSQPMVAMAVVIPSFLFFAGCGSGMADRLATRTATSRLTWIRNRPAGLAAGAIILISALYLWLLPPLFRLGAVWPDTVRIAVSILLIGALAVWMGMPFPLGLTRVGHKAPNLVALAWGVNGFFSVLSAIAATLLALHAGHRAVIAAALGLYLLAAALERRL